MATESSTTPSFAAWAGTVSALCDQVEALAPLAASLGAEDPASTEWYAALFGKLRPQVAREPLLVAAICGGTNTGKSLITNTLVGAAISRSIAEAARTLHPVASLARGPTSRRRACPGPHRQYRPCCPCGTAQRATVEPPCGNPGRESLPQT
jgi:hypothetical protein